MAKRCSFCGKEYDDTEPNDSCGACQIGSLFTLPATDARQESGEWLASWSAVESEEGQAPQLPRGRAGLYASQEYIRAVAAALSENERNMGDKGRKRVRDGTIQSVITRKQNALNAADNAKGKTPNRGIANKRRDLARKGAYACRTWQKNGSGPAMLAAHATAERLYLAQVGIRSRPPATPGVHRRNSVGFEHDLPAASDSRDATRMVLGRADKLDINRLERVVKIAVLSTHGQGDRSMCGGYVGKVSDALSNTALYPSCYVNAMTRDTEATPDQDIRVWMEEMLERRARPDVIILLEGHVQTDLLQSDWVIGADRYIRVDSPKQAMRRDHLQNITGWILSDAVASGFLQLSIVEVQVTGDRTLMALITHTVGDAKYYEFVCHLPSSHYRQYAGGAPDMPTWYRQQIQGLQAAAGSEVANVINVMGDTNFNTAYDDHWSPSPTLGGELEASTDRALPASSGADTRFMRQMCNATFDWSKALIRVHRASYLNFKHVLNGSGMAATWGTDHPSFMSYTSIYTRKPAKKKAKTGPPETGS